MWRERERERERERDEEISYFKLYNFCVSCTHTLSMFDRSLGSMGQGVGGPGAAPRHIPAPVTIQLNHSS